MSQGGSRAVPEASASDACRIMYIGDLENYVLAMYRVGRHGIAQVKKRRGPHCTGRRNTLIIS